MTQTTADRAMIVTRDTTPDTQANYAFSNNLVVISDPNGVDAESISALRNHLTASHLNEGRRGLTISAPNAADGALWLAANLAVALAQSGVRTLLVDCDLRSGGLEKLIQPHDAIVGLSELLEDRKMSLSNVVRSNVVRNLSVIYAGTPSDNAQQLVFGPQMARAFDLCLRDFDLTIAVPPPAKQRADARRIALLTHYALVVGRKDQTLLADLKTLIAEFRADGVNVIGSVYNGS
ncbi:MAG: diutan polysaccharide export protein [Sphingomonas sp.]|uniref:diutan polysaccharide export protein n=1 Tax=Sphingomonas sp. TaxID=28214 RepID=UPI0025E9343B|nr:diutan polysaccharide export protein [Sphingomonas sp.]MBX9881843.1 diutan polysaccharide export protein [Sphingomonas sp.]